MSSMKRWTLSKVVAIFLCLFIAGEAHYLLAAQDPVQAVDPLEAQFQAARTAYFAEKYEEAKTVLEKLIGDLGAIDGRDTFKGTTFLLAGATYEKLKFKELAIKYFCKAKAILGEDKTIEGLELKKLKYYLEDCTSGAGSIAGAAQAAPKRGFFGSLLGTLLFLAVGAGVVWYLFFSPNAPFKKKSDSSSSSSTTTFKAICFSTAWHVNIESTWEVSAGTISFSPSDKAPQPSESNGWDDSVTYTLSASGGGTLKSVSMTLSVDVGGGDNGKRHDLAYIDGALVLDKTNTFTQPCSTPGSVSYNNIYSRTSLGSFTLRHKVELSAAQALSSHLDLVKK
jgi:hypothetical protein